MKEVLEEMYQNVMHKYGYVEPKNMQNINRMVKEFLFVFVEACKTPAIWCYGNHTKMLMTDFIYEMKSTKFVIDAKYAGCKESGFKIINEEEIETNQIDGIIISSFLYKEEIKQRIKDKFPNIKYLDIYEKLEEAGVVLRYEYYSQLHPYAHYININEFKRQLTQTIPNEEKAQILAALLGEYLLIKDFKTGIACLKEFIAFGDIVKNRELLRDLEHLYRLELECAAGISENHVVMLCIDGLRRRDILDGLMPRMMSYVDQNITFFQNAYSVSTSTYESLIPTYSENSDLRTEYCKFNLIPEDQCRFIQEAIKQKREIYFYTDSTAYIESKYINIADKLQTASEKIWDFILQAMEGDNGLYYIHILYESHFSFPNPYTAAPLIVDGASIMFDYLSRNGQKIRTDYIRQHRDALQYLDDFLCPFIELLNCRMVLYADHGNVILDRETKLENIENTKLSFHEDLIQVPLIIKSPEMDAKISKDLCSIMELNKIIIGLMNREKINIRKNHHIKVVRSELYNPDFKYIYQKRNYEQGLLAFEVFLFDSGYKLAVFSNGVRELFKIETDERVEDSKMLEEFWEQIKGEVTVAG